MILPKTRKGRAVWVQIYFENIWKYNVLYYNTIKYFSFFPHDAIEVQSGKKRNEKSVRTMSTWCPGHSRQTTLSKSTKREMLLVTRWEQKSWPFVQRHSVIRKFHEKLRNLGGLVFDCLVSEVVWSNILNQRRITVHVSNVQQYDLSCNRLAHHCSK